MIAPDFRERVADVVSRLVEDARSGRTETDLVPRHVSEEVDVIGRQAERFLRVRRKLVEMPARHVEAYLVEQRRTEGVIPKNRAAFVQAAGVPEVGRARVSVEELRVVRNVIHAESDQIS